MALKKKRLFQKYALLKAIIVGILIFLIDGATKFLTYRYIPLMSQHFLWYPYGGIAVFRDFLGIEFSLVHATNRGAAWGVLADYQWYLLFFRIVLVLTMLIYFLYYNKNPTWKIPLMMIIAGATGNILDAFIYGHVVDMLHVVLWGHDFPVFNIADSSIFLGISWLVINSRDAQKVKIYKSKKT